MPASTWMPATPACSPIRPSWPGRWKRPGIRYGRGFSANASNFQWTADVVTWSQQLERSLGGTVGAVIDTSRNGRGPYTGPDAPQWCNPPGRALGRPRSSIRAPPGSTLTCGSKIPAPATEPVTRDLRPASSGPQYAEALEQQRQQA